MTVYARHRYSKEAERANYKTIDLNGFYKKNSAL